MLQNHTQNELVIFLYTPLSPSNNFCLVLIGSYILLSTNMSFNRPAPSSEVEEMERMKLLVKPNAYELSNTKIVYNLPKADEKTLIVRSIRDGEKYASFGVSGEQAVNYVYYATLAILDSHREQFQEKAKFGGGKLLALLQRISDQDREKMNQLFNPDGSLIELPTTHLKISGNFAPQVAVMTMHINEDLERVMKTGVYLHLSEAMKLVRYMNSTMNIGDSDLGTNFVFRKYEDEDLF